MGKLLDLDEVFGESARTKTVLTVMATVPVKVVNDLVNSIIASPAPIAADQLDLPTTYTPPSSTYWNRKFERTVDPRIVAGPVRRDPHADVYVPTPMAPKGTGPPSYHMPSASDCGPPPPIFVTPLTPQELSINSKAVAEDCHRYAIEHSNPLDIAWAKYRAGLLRGMKVAHDQIVAANSA